MKANLWKPLGTPFCTEKTVVGRSIRMWIMTWSVYSLFMNKITKGLDNLSFHMPIIKRSDNRVYKYNDSLCVLFHQVFCQLQFQYYKFFDMQVYLIKLFYFHLFICCSSRSNKNYIIHQIISSNSMLVCMLTLSRY